MFYLREICSVILEDFPRHGEEAMEVVRLLTFQTLGMAHTCCYRDLQLGDGGPTMVRNLPDEEEIEELQKEDQDSKKILECLMEKFRDQYLQLCQRESGCSITEFIEGHWAKRMNVFIFNQDRPDRTGQDEAELLEAEEIGVAWDKGTDTDDSHEYYHTTRRSPRGPQEKSMRSFEDW